MENMIRRMMDMDKKAQEITAEALAEKLHSEQDATEKAAALKKNYLESARRRIQMNAESERTMAEQRWKKKDKTFTAQEQQLQKTYDAHASEWIDHIVHAVTAR